MLCAVGAIVVCIGAWFSAIFSYIFLLGIRQDIPRALFIRPWFFLFDNSLPEEGKRYRTRLLRSVGVFAVSAFLLALILFGSMAYCGNYAGDCLVVYY